MTHEYNIGCDYFFVVEIKIAEKESKTPVKSTEGSAWVVSICLLNGFK